MKLISWNVNSIRPRLERVQALLARHQPDLLCLQETKVQDAEFPHEALAEVGYRAEVFGQKTYNGVALVSREPVEVLARGFEGNPVEDEARAIAGRLDGVTVVNLYVVNGQALDSPKYPTKLEWLSALAGWLEGRFDPAEPLVLLGDFNIAPTARDIHDPPRWEGKVLASPPERERLAALLDWGLTDLYRHLEPEGTDHTWWDYRFGAFHRGWGLRIDLALGTAPITARCRSVTVDREERKKTSGEGTPSDHAPVIVELE